MNTALSPLVLYRVVHLQVHDVFEIMLVV